MWFANPPARAQLCGRAAKSGARGSKVRASPLVIMKQAPTRLDVAVEVIQSMEPWAERVIEPMLLPVASAWQPQDFLPEPSSPDFIDQVAAMRRDASNLPNDFLAVLVGDMVTEEALPSYMSMLNRMLGVRDESGADDTSWARWNRAWTSEENRHGDLLNKYLYLTGKVDMRSVEVTIQHLIGSGFDPMMANNPYNCFVYTSFQERATKVSHANTAKHAQLHGNSHLARICSAIAGDEARHESAYQRVMGELFRRDADGAMLAFADMMRTSIVMPAHLLNDDCLPEAAPASASAQPPRSDLFNNFASVAERVGVYTAQDYADIVEWLVKRWHIDAVTGLSGEAAEAQEYLCKHPDRMRRMANVHTERKERLRNRGSLREGSFAWLHGKAVAL